MISTTATDLPRVMQCLGSVDMPPSLPPSATDEARQEGNAAHWLAQEMFDGRAVNVGMRAPNGYVVTDEMLDYTSQYVSALDCGQMEVNTSWGDEVRGRADHIVAHRYDPSTDEIRSLVIDEFKTGHRLVEVVENWTLLSHAIGWCIREQAAPQIITLRVHQPRGYHPDGPLRSWSISYADLMGYHARIAARLSETPDTLQTGPACAKCPALATCPAARSASMNAIDASTTTFTDDLPDPILAAEYELLDGALRAIETRRDALGELMTHRITEGHVIPDYALKPRLGQTRWNTGMSGAIISAMTGVDCTKDALCTPAEAKRRGVPENVIGALTHRPNIGTKLTRINVDREARRAFGGT